MLAEHRIRVGVRLLGREGQAEGAGEAAAPGDLLAVAAARPCATGGRAAGYGGVPARRDCH